MHQRFVLKNLIVKIDPELIHKHSCYVNTNIKYFFEDKYVILCCDSSCTSMSVQRHHMFAILADMIIFSTSLAERVPSVAEVPTSLLCCRIDLANTFVHLSYSF